MYFLILKRLEFTMLSAFYRWLYHFRLRRDARNRLSGRVKPTQRFWRFGDHVLHRANFDKYDHVRSRRSVVVRIVLVVLGLVALWFVWQSLMVWNIFQD